MSSQAKRLALKWEKLRKICIFITRDMPFYTQIQLHFIPTHYAEIRVCFRRRERKNIVVNNVKRDKIYAAAAHK